MSVVHAHSFPDDQFASSSMHKQVAQNTVSTKHNLSLSKMQYLSSTKVWVTSVPENISW
jgi:hypothetical protein